MRSVLVNGHVWHEDERRRKSLWLSLQFLWSSLISAPVVRWWADSARWLVWKPTRISIQRDDLPQNLKGWNLWNLNRAKALSMDCLFSSHTHTCQICSSALHPKVKILHPPNLWNFAPLLVLWTDKFPLPLTEAPPSAPLPWPIEITLKYCTLTLTSSLERKSNIQCKIWNCPSHPVF